jgi:hypothetical protein
MCIKWEDNIIINLTETRVEAVAWIQVAQDRDQWRILVNMVMNQKSSIKGNKYVDKLIYY